MTNMLKTINSKVAGQEPIIMYPKLFLFVLIIMFSSKSPLYSQYRTYHHMTEGEILIDWHLWHPEIELAYNIHNADSYTIKFPQKNSECLFIKNEPGPISKQLMDSVTTLIREIYIEKKTQIIISKKRIPGGLAASTDYNPLQIFICLDGKTSIYETTPVKYEGRWEYSYSNEILLLYEILGKIREVLTVYYEDVHF